MPRASKKKKGTEPLPGVELANVLSNRWRFRIVTELTTRPMSVAQFVRDVGGEQSNISRRFKQLVDWGFLELVEEKRGGSRRGGVERIYRSVLPARFDAPVWGQLPAEMRDDVSRNILDLLSRRINEALASGTFDQDVDRHLSEARATLDQPALLQLSRQMEEVLDSLPGLEREARARTEKGEGEPVTTTVGLLAFRSPPLEDEGR